MKLTAHKPFDRLKWDKYLQDHVPSEVDVGMAARITALLDICLSFDVDPVVAGCALMLHLCVHERFCFFYCHVHRC